jgi:MFS family permease
MLALSYANDWGWGSPRLLATAGAAVLLLVAFVLVERRAAAPLVDVGLFRNRLFSAGIVAGLLSYAVLFGVLFLVPFYLERARSLPTSAVGLLLSPVPLALGVLAPLAGLLTDRIGSRLPTVVGMLGATVALVLLAVLPDSPGVVLIAGLALLGIGLGLFTPPNNSAVMGSAPAHRLGLASGVLNMTRSLGTGLGVAATGAVLALRLAAHAGHPVAGTAEVVPPLLEAAFRETLLFLAALAGTAALISAARGPATPVARTRVPGKVGAVGGAEGDLDEARRIAEAEAMGG